MGLLFSLVICVSLQSIFSIKSFSDRGELLVDGSFDLLQFTRTVFIYFDFFGVVIFTILLDRYYVKYKTNNGILIFATIGYSIFVLVMISNNTSFYLPNSNLVKPKWSLEVVSELQNYRNEKKAIVSDDHYSGQFIAAHDIGGFVISIQNGIGGYTSTNRNYYMYRDFVNFIEGSNPDFINVIKREKIKILIATPNTLKDFENLELKRKIIHIENTNWLYSPVF